MDGKTNQFPCCIVSYTVPEGLWEGWRGPRKQQQYLEIVSPKATTLPSLSHITEPRFPLLRVVLFHSKIIDANASSSPTLLRGYGKGRTDKARVTNTAKRTQEWVGSSVEMRQERKVWAALGRCSGQGERLTSIDVSQEGAVKGTVFLLGCAILGTLSMWERSRGGGEGGHQDEGGGQLLIN